MWSSLVVCSTFRALSRDQEALLFIVYYGEIVGSREISIDFREPITI